MREIFQTINDYPLISFFVGVFIIIVLDIIFDAISKIGRRK